MIRISPAAPCALLVRLLVLVPLLGGCSLDTGDDGGTDPGIERCDDCNGEDGGTPAPPGINGRTVAVIQTDNPYAPDDEYVLRATIPVPPRTYPRADGKEPFVVLDWDGSVLPAQTEIVSRYALDSDGADVVEVLAKASRDPGLPDGAPVQYEVVQSPMAALPDPGTPGLEDLRATQNLPADLLAALNDPNAIEIRAYDCFGNKYVVRPLDGTGDYRLMRHGRVMSEVRVYQTMMPEPFVPGLSGTLPHFLGVHTYLRTYQGSGVLGLDVRFNNGQSGRDPNTTTDNPLNKVYFEKIQVVAPANFGLRTDFEDPFFGGHVTEGTRWVWDLVEPMPAGKMHVIRWLGQFHRRLWLAPPTAGGDLWSYSHLQGQGFCKRGTDPIFGHEYWSWWNKGTARYFPQKYQMPSLDHANLGNLRTEQLNERNYLANHLLNGTGDGNYPVASGVLGWGHPYGVSYGGMTSGNEIFMFDGVRLANCAAKWGIQKFNALHRMHTDRMPNVLYDLDGEPSSVERWLTENGDRDYVPFYHFGVPMFLLGFSSPDPFGYGTAPRFQIDHVAANGLAPGYEAQHFAFDPHDYQHFIRYTRSAKVLTWLANDAIAKDDIRIQAEMFNLSFHEHFNDQYGGYATSGLRAHRAYVAANPHKGGPFGRGEAWGLDAAVAAYSTGTLAWRAAKRPWLNAILDLLAEQQGACNGFLQAIVSDKAVDGRYRARQLIEQSITENALQGLRESVYRGADLARSNLTRDVMIESLYAFIGTMAWNPGFGPWRYTGIGPLDINQPVWCSFSQMPSDAVTPGDYETYQDWSSFAYGYEITGDPLFLERAMEQFGFGNDLWINLRNGGAQNVENRAALVALMQHINGIL